MSSSEDEDVDVGMDDVVVESSKKPTKSVVKEQPVKPVKPVSTQGRKRVLKKKGRPKKLTGAKNDVVGGQNDKGMRGSRILYLTLYLHKVCFPVSCILTSS